MNIRKPNRGRIEFAEYKDTGVPHYKNFPMIEALPEILDAIEATKKIKVLKKFNPEELQLSPSKRKHCVEQLATYLIPLNKHLEVEQKLSIFIRQGYLSRNITNNDHIRRMRNAILSLKKPEIAELERQAHNVPLPTSSALGIIGISGAGKSTGITRILNIYPQVIIHEKYEEKQLVWLKIDCPVTGTIKQLCLSFIKEMGELMGGIDYNEYKDYKTDELIIVISALALEHHLGVLVIDEIQYLHEHASGGVALMLNFFNTLINTIGVPIVLIGTPKARHLFTKEFRNIKRITAQGSIEWDRLKATNSDWKTLLKFLWKHQWTLKKAELTPEIEEALYYESQGIPDLVVKIFKESQKRVIGAGELLSPSVIHSVAQDQFRILQPPLEALRSGNKKEMEKYVDIFMSYDPATLITTEEKRVYEDTYGINLEEALYEQEQDNQLQVIINWLMDADFSAEVARSVANETKLADLNQWKRAAYQAALDYKAEPITERIPKLSSKDTKARQSQRKHKPNSLYPVLALKEKEKNATFYELIKRAGYVQDVRLRLGL